MLLSAAVNARPSAAGYARHERAPTRSIKMGKPSVAPWVGREFNATGRPAYSVKAKLR